MLRLVKLVKKQHCPCIHRDAV